MKYIVNNAWKYILLYFTTKTAVIAVKLKSVLVNRAFDAFIKAFVANDVMVSRGFSRSFETKITYGAKRINADADVSCEFLYSASDNEKPRMAHIVDINAFLTKRRIYLMNLI